MIWLALMLQAVPATPAQTPAPPGSDIVVVARSGKAALEACIARACPPDQEIKAALVVASQAFLAGDYAGARRTLLETRGRNAKFDKTYPLPVSDLHRALNTLANLDGRPDAARLSALDATDALRAGLKPDDPLILLQRLDTASQLARETRIIAARQIYDDVVKRANKAGYPGVEAQAMFQAASLYTALASVDPGYRDAATQWVNRLEKRREPEFAPFREGIALVKLQIAATQARGKRGAVLANAKPLASREAFLLDEPAVTFSVSDPRFATVAGGNNRPEWADVAFWVQPDGSVRDLTVIGRSSSPPGSWLATKTEAVAKRRYAPFTGAAIYRVERYSMVYSFGLQTGSHMPSRSARGLLNTTDVTAAHPAPAA